MVAEQFKFTASCETVSAVYERAQHTDAFGREPESFHRAGHHYCASLAPRISSIVPALSTKIRVHPCSSAAMTLRYRAGVDKDTIKRDRLSVGIQFYRL
jgi:hypothetical protein